MDFLRDRLEDGRSFFVVDVIHDFNFEVPGIDGDFSSPRERAVRTVKAHSEVIDLDLHRHYAYGGAAVACVSHGADARDGCGQAVQSGEIGDGGVGTSG